MHALFYGAVAIGGLTLARLLVRARRPGGLLRRPILLAAAKSATPMPAELVGEVVTEEEVLSPLTGARCVAWQVHTLVLTDQPVVAPLRHRVEHVARIALTDASGAASVEIQGQVQLDVKPTRRLVLREEAERGAGAALLERLGVPPPGADAHIAAYRLDEHVVATGALASLVGLVSSVTDPESGGYRTAGRRLRVQPTADGPVRISLRRRRHGKVIG